MQAWFPKTFNALGILSYLVSNQWAQHGGAQRKIFNIKVPQWLEKVFLGAFVVHGVRRACPKCLFSKGKSCHLCPHRWKAGVFACSHVSTLKPTINWRMFINFGKFENPLASYFDPLIY